MAYLLYYANERAEFKEYFEKMLPEDRYDSIHMVLEKLYRHFKLGKPNITVTSGRNHSSCGLINITINRDDASIATIAHEVGHALCAKKYGLGKVHHSRKHRTQMKRVLNYLIKHNYFQDELGRRLAPKPEKPKPPEPTKDEIKQKELIRIENRMLWYLKTIKVYQKRVKKIQGTINRKKAWLIKDTKIQSI